MSKPVYSPEELDEKPKHGQFESDSQNAVQAGDMKEIATAAGVKPGPRLLFACFVAYLCSCANGYDGSLMTGINAMTFYQGHFHPGTTGQSTSLIFAIYTVGQMVAAWLAGPLTDRYGRRVGMASGGCFVILGAILACFAKDLSMLVGARFVLGFGICIMTTAAPSYAVEIAPPQYRGRMTGFYNTGWFGGAIPAALIVYGCQNIGSNWSWRIPLLLQCVPSAAVICSIAFIPESPRWLFAQGRTEEAHAFLAKYHGGGDSNNAIVQLQIREFSEAIAMNGTDKRWYDYSGLFKTSNARWRTLMMIFMGVFGQFSGNGLGYFNTVVFDNLGYTDVKTQLALNIGGQLISATGALTAMALTDKMRRRPVLIYGTAACAALLGINGGLSTAFSKDTSNIRLGQGSLAAYYLFNLVISFTYTPLQALYPVECLETTSRAKGMAMYAFTVNAISFINLYATPIALGNIKNNYIYVFVGWDFIEALLWYLFAVETQGRTLEELEDIFSSSNPVKASKQPLTPSHPEL